MKDVYILAVETSCDETSIAVIKNGSECVALSVFTQMDTHAKFGGVVPEIASRMHTENITMVLEDALKKSEMKIEEMDAIAVTYTPGLMGSLLVGLEFAKTLCLIYNKPLIKVNHIAGHIYANNLTSGMKYPLVALVVSGGHTNLIEMQKDYDFKVIGNTLDDAIGECYDKVARILEEPYPGGPNVEKLASKGIPSYKLPISMKDDSYNFSFSGLKSAVINLVHNENQRHREINKYDLACSFQTVAIKQICSKLELYLKKNSDIKNLIIAGGVSANKYLREEITKIANKYAMNLSIPKFIYCTDNAAMIGAAAYPLYLKGEFSELNINAKCNEPLY